MTKGFASVNKKSDTVICKPSNGASVIKK